MHDQNIKFYKYLSSSSAVAALNNGTLKWSSVNLFNDPFEFPSNIGFSVDGNEIAKLLLDELVELVYGKEQPVGDLSSPLFANAMAARNNPDNPSEKEYRNYMQSALEDTAIRFKKGMDGLYKYFEKEKEAYSVFCVSKNHDNLLMWSHYAQEHMGCVFKFKCIPELDRPLCAARQVKYQKEYPMISDTHTYIKHLTGQHHLNYENLFDDFAYTKSDNWAYEDEWRCVGGLRDIKNGFDFDPLVPEELEAIYLGCRITPHIKKDVLDIISKKYPKTDVYQAKLAQQNFALDFDKLS